MHYDAWIRYVFDHPVHDPAWHWADDAPYHDVGIPEVAELLTKTFRQSAHGKVRTILDRFLSSRTGIPSRLLEYVEDARDGSVL